MKWNKLEEIIRHAYNTVPLYVDIAEREDYEGKRISNGNSGGNGDCYFYIGMQ